MLVNGLIFNIYLNNMKISKVKKYKFLKNISKYSFVFILAFTLIFPMIFVNTANSDYAIETEIENPLGDSGADDLPTFIEKAIDIVLTIGIPIVVLAIIYSGFLFIQAQGNPEKLKTAKKTLLFTIIGATLLLGSYVIANAIGNTVDEIKSSS